MVSVYMESIQVSFIEHPLAFVEGTLVPVCFCETGSVVYGVCV